MIHLGYFSREFKHQSVANWPALRNPCAAGVMCIWLRIPLLLYTCNVMLLASQICVDLRDRVYVCIYVGGTLRK